jgi:hypothetical protein
VRAHALRLELGQLLVVELEPSLLLV